MSYALQIWEAPIPSTVQEAADINEQLQDEFGSQNPKFIALARQLTKRYPCISQLTGEEEEGYEEGVWSDGPLDGETSNPVYGVGITSDHIAEVLPFVVQTAQSLGLTVYDDQVGQVHLPSGQLLTMPGQTPVGVEEPEEDPEYIKSAAHSGKIAKQHITSYLKSHGFIYDKARQGFIKSHDGFYHIVRVGGGGYYIQIVTSVGVTHGLELAIHLPFVNLVTPHVLIINSSLKLNIAYPDVPPPFEHLGYISVKKVSDIRSSLNKVTAYFDKTYMHFVRATGSLQNLDHCFQMPFNQLPFANSRSFYIAKLLVAHITQNRDIDTVIEEVGAEFTRAYSQYIDEFDKTVENIKLERAKNNN
jgi:hypothetical protein